MGVLASGGSRIASEALQNFRFGSGVAVHLASNRSLTDRSPSRIVEHPVLRVKRSHEGSPVECLLTDTPVCSGHRPRMSQFSLEPPADLEDARTAPGRDQSVDRTTAAVRLADDRSFGVRWQPNWPITGEEISYRLDIAKRVAILVMARSESHQQYRGRDRRAHSQLSTTQFCVARALQAMIGNGGSRGAWGCWSRR